MASSTADARRAVVLVFFTRWFFITQVARGLFHVTIVRPYGYTFDAYASAESHVAYLLVRRIVKNKVMKKYQLM